MTSGIGILVSSPLLQVCSDSNVNGAVHGKSPSYVSGFSRGMITSDMCFKTSWYCIDILSLFGRSKGVVFPSCSCIETTSLPVLLLISASNVQAVCDRSIDMN